MAHVFMPRIFEPPVPGLIKVTIDGVGDYSQSFVTIYDTKYAEPASGIEVMSGDVITFYMYGYSKLTIDGTIVVSETGDDAEVEYEWIIPDVHNISITFDFSITSDGYVNYNYITVTTS